ncbi:hypothetical protein ABPG74_019298 [Tetrahymena malaccensis]
MEQIITKKCEIHQRLIEHANINSSCQQPFLCPVCQIKNRNDQFIYISEVFSNQETLPIQNWPPGLDQSILDFLCLNSQEDKSEVIKNKIQSYYKEFICQIMLLVEESEESALRQIDQEQLSRNNLISYYNNSFKRKELQEALQNLNEPQKYLELLKEVELTKEQHILELQSRVQLLACIENKADFGKPQQLKNIIQQLIKQISFFPQQQNQIIDNRENSNIEQNQEQIVEILNKYLDIKDHLNMLLKKKNSLKYKIDQQNALLQDINEGQRIKSEAEIYNSSYIESEIMLDQQQKQLNQLQDMLKQEFQQLSKIEIPSNITNNVINSLLQPNNHRNVPQNYEMFHQSQPNDLFSRDQNQNNALLRQNMFNEQSRLISVNQNLANNSIVRYDKNTSILQFTSYDENFLPQKDQDNNIIFPGSQKYNIFTNQIPLDIDLTYIYKFRIKKQNNLLPQIQRRQSSKIIIGLQNYFSDFQKKIELNCSDLTDQFEVIICHKLNTIRVKDQSTNFNIISSIFYDNKHFKDLYNFYITTEVNEVTLCYYEVLKYCIQ